jgi:hypothetical protein
MDGFFSRREAIASTIAAGLLPSVAAHGWQITSGLPDGLVPHAARWLVGQFGDVFRAQLQGTPFTVGLLAAFACQESGYVWYKRAIRTAYTPQDLLRLLVLDNSTPRNSFPRDTATFIADSRFADIAPVLVQASDVSRVARGLKANGNLLFGYGLFQYDLQHIVTDPSFWRAPSPGGADGQTGMWGDAGACVERWLSILTAKYVAAGGNKAKAIELYNGQGANARVYAGIVLRFERLIGAV